MKVVAWLQPPRHLLVCFLAVTLVPAGGLVWLGWRLLEQDRALESQRAQERREHAADRVVSGLSRLLGTAQQGLADADRANDPAPGDDALVAIFRSQSLEVFPATPLLYYPSVPRHPEAPQELYLAGEQREFVHRDYGGAIERFRALARSPDRAVRAGAQLRIARNYRKAGQSELALGAYAQLAGLDGVALEGLPAELVGRRARCAVLEEMGRREELSREAAALYEALLGGKWRLTRPVWELHAGQVRKWLGVADPGEEERAALADGVEWVFEQWQAARAGGPPLSKTSTLAAHGRTLTILANAAGTTVVALVAGPRYVERQWLAASSSVLEGRAVQVSLRDAAGNRVCGAAPVGRDGQTVRPAPESGLPWNVIVASVDPQADLAYFSSRRRLLLAGLALAAILVVAGTCLVARAVSRELAVARLKSDFVAAVSHEFRTPLATLRQLIENLADGRLPSEERRQVYYQAQARATGRLHRLVERLLDFGRMEAGAFRYRPELLDLGEVAHSVVEEFEQVTQASGHRIDLAVDPKVPRVRADREALGQALWNLLDNAIKYSPGRPAVAVEVACEGGLAAIRIRDEGLGIPAGERKDLFRKFARGSAARTACVKGTGIGLAMVDYIVRAHRGLVRVESTPGRGSTFTVLLKPEAP